MLVASRAPRSTNSARISLRTNPEAKALIEHAAALIGTTVSGFVTQNSYAAAQRILADHATLTQLQKDLDVFVATCDGAAETPETLRHVLAGS